MDSETLQYKINKYTARLKAAKTKNKAWYYQRKLKQYHQINQFGGFIDSPSDAISNATNGLKTKITQTFESNKSNPYIMNELSKIISETTTKLANLSGGNYECNVKLNTTSPPSEGLINSIKQYFNQTSTADYENMHDVDVQNINQQSETDGLMQEWNNLVANTES
jgi:hypothetical protein